MNKETLNLLLPEGLFFIRKNLEDFDEQTLSLLLEKIFVVGDYDRRINNVQFLLGLMHQAYEKDSDSYLKNVFFPWVSLRKKTNVHKNRVFDEIARIAEYEKGSEAEISHVVNIYRNIVADLFDPYLTLIVASYQFIEGTFTNLTIADLSQGERNKVEYIQSRIKNEWIEPNILSGYNPIVRNAISHAGAKGITFMEGKVNFRNIKRENDPVVQSVTWTHEELYLHTIELAEAIVSIGICEEIFGLDITETIQKSLTNDFDMFSQFAWHALSKEQRRNLYSRNEQFSREIIENRDLPLEEKFRALTYLLFKNCGLRKMDISEARYNLANRIVSLSIPPQIIDTTSEQELLSRIVELSRYAVIARSIYLDMFDLFIVEEVDAKGNRQIKASLQGTLLDEYAREDAGIIDLLNESSFMIESENLHISIDFDQLSASESNSLEDNYPRKKQT